MPPKLLDNAKESLNVEFPFEYRIFKLNNSPLSHEQLTQIDAICVSERAQFLVFQDTSAEGIFDNAIMIFFPIPKYGEDTQMREALDPRSIVAAVLEANPNLGLRDSGFYNSEKHDIYGISPVLGFELQNEFLNRTLQWRNHLKDTLNINVFPFSHFQ